MKNIFIAVCAFFLGCLLLFQGYEGYQERSNLASQGIEVLSETIEKYSMFEKDDEIVRYGLHVEFVTTDGRKTTCGGYLDPFLMEEVLASSRRVTVRYLPSHLRTCKIVGDAEKYGYTFLYLMMTGLMLFIGSIVFFTRIYLRNRNHVVLLSEDDL